MTLFAMSLDADWKRQKALEAVSKAPEGTIVTIKESTRTLEQNAKFHALCGDAAANLVYMGKRRTLKQWKILFVSGHAIATGRETEILPGLEGEFINLREPTAQMGVARMSSLIEYTQAYLDAEISGLDR